MLVDAKSEASSVGKVYLLKLVLLHLKGTIQNLLGLETTDLFIIMSVTKIESS